MIIFWALFFPASTRREFSNLLPLMSNQYITQSDTNIHKYEIYDSHEMYPNKKRAKELYGLEIFWNLNSRNWFEVINSNVFSGNDNKRIQNDSKLLSIKMNRSNLNRILIHTL